ncbi:NifC-like ABC-type porter [Acidothermus cellulolyticus 11B]|uniref:Molybdenum transport system permease n=1 Tax=Acidothermus cellulolyticus (strain ATCC 43068 / DSM 8971 / 11B) TaxID=351607 RepID=A0LWK1_ACIC1|nr:ABC transporter permease [Acidothermus cellulolyticus]ABK53811.1 NifC-like ABC-type porter [Acidothermus cellulolyticus 11B]
MPASTSRRYALQTGLVAVFALAGFLFLCVPLVSLAVRAPWRNLVAELGKPEALTALRLSLETATIATFLSLLVGLPLAWTMCRLPTSIRNAARAVIALPLVLPPVAGGLTLLLAYGRRGLVGSWLWHAAGISLPFTTAGVVVAETFVAMPFLVLSVEGALRAVDTKYADVASTLGAGPLFIFRRVVLPIVLPAVFAGSLLCWARAIGEFGATITFAGSFPGTTRTMPLEIYLQFQHDPQSAIGLSLVLLLASTGVLLALWRRWIAAL